MYSQFSKRVRAQLRELAATAYERELRELLAGVENAFVRWRKGEIDTFALAAEVEQFSRGSVKRDLHYHYHNTSMLHLSVAHAIVRGVLKSEEVPGDALVALEPALKFYRQVMAEGTKNMETKED